MEKRRKKQMENQEGKRLHTVTDWVVDVIVVVVLAVFFVQMLGEQIRVEGHSMEPALMAEDTVLINRLSYSFFSVERFDVVLFQNPKSEEKIHMKRVIGLPGETVQIKNGKIQVNGSALPERELPEYTVPGLAENPVTLGDDEYFLLGDNGDSSEDSRFAIIGNVHRDQILGKVWFRIAPFSKLGFIKD
ncbi:signal peptidase I [Hominifimenecus sp. rT4P-3]|uniref:signal peptidase I n=1 Tax=Hominifimenecus sp. rT4P-3 TaxID=3242979 RepID=UPI003DA32B47